MSHPLVTPRVMWQRVPLRVPRALLSSQEAPEDDPRLGALSLQQVEETASERVCVWGHIIMCVCFTLQVCEGKKRVLFVGISCGLSVSHWYYVCLHMKIIWGKNTNFVAAQAPFVAGQLDFCLQHPEVYTPVLVGFNPSHQARFVNAVYK